MAKLNRAKTIDEIKSLGVAAVRKAYGDLAVIYNKLLDQQFMLCHKCGDFMARDVFYKDIRYATGVYPKCKRCVMMEVEQRVNKNDPPNITKESVQRVLQDMDLPYIDKFYTQCVTNIDEGTRESAIGHPFSAYLSTIKSLNQYKDKKWKDSVFGETEEMVEGNYSIRKNIRKLFGAGRSDEDYLFLQNTYDDWASRTQVDSKSQEVYVTRICCKLLEIWKAERAGKDTGKLDASLNDLMAAANLQPKQNVGNAATDSLTFGQLIEKWELEEPIPDPEPEFKDIDGIGKYIRVFFKGHLAKALGFDNAYSREYDDFMKQYTVNKPSYTDTETSEDIYSALFRKDVE